MANFSDDISTMEKLAKSVSDKARTVTDADEITEVGQAQAHIHNAYLILNRISKKD
jgi:hypothetical protein